MFQGTYSVLAAGVVQVHERCVARLERSNVQKKEQSVSSKRAWWNGEHGRFVNVMYSVAFLPLEVDLHNRLIHCKYYTGHFLSATPECSLCCMPLIFEESGPTYLACCGNSICQSCLCQIKSARMDEEKICVARGQPQLL